MDDTRIALRSSVIASRNFASALFDQLRRDGLDEPGVSRDPYGAGEQRAHKTCAGGGGGDGSEGRARRRRQPLHDPPRPRPSATPIVIGWHSIRSRTAATSTARPASSRAWSRWGAAPSWPRRQGSTCGDGHPGRRKRLVSGFLYRQPAPAWDLAGRRPGGPAGRYRPHTRRPHRRVRRRSRADLRLERHFDPATCAPTWNSISSRRRQLVEAGRSVGIGTGIPGNFRYPTHGSRAATIMSACRAGSAATPRWPGRSSPWRSTRFGRTTTGAAFPWPARSAVSIPMPKQHGLTIVPGAFHFSLDVRAYDEACWRTWTSGSTHHRGDRAKPRRPVSSRRQGARRGRAGRSGDPGRLTACAATLGIETIAFGSPASHDAAASRRAACRWD